MMKFIRYNLWKAKKAAGPSSHFKSALWNKLERAWDEKHLPEYRWYQTHLFRLSSAVISAFLVVGSFSTAVYAYNSPEVTDGTPLYPVKQAIEGVEGKLQKTPEQRAKYLLKQIRRREAEKAVEEKRSQNLQRVEENIKNAESELQKVDQELNDTPEGNQLRKKIKNHLEIKRMRLEKQVQRLQRREDSLAGSSANTKQD